MHGILFFLRTSQYSAGTQRVLNGHATIALLRATCALGPSQSPICKDTRGASHTRYEYKRYTYSY